MSGTTPRRSGPGGGALTLSLLALTLALILPNVGHLALPMLGNTRRHLFSHTRGVASVKNIGLMDISVLRFYRYIGVYKLFKI